jgi:hypothetical protein
MGLPGAVEALQEALTIGRECYEVDHGSTMVTARMLEIVLDEEHRQFARLDERLEI